MASELLDAIVSWKALLVAVLVFGFAPGALLRLIVLAFHRDDPRRSELLAELHRVPRVERPFWVFEQLEVALFEGVWERILWAGAGRLYDRWRLGSGVKHNREHPETFWIPDEVEKQAIEPGVSVKLMFDTTDLWGRRNWGERMWVEVVAVKRHHIVGVLANQPVGIPRLSAGDMVKFRREHIIDIHWECTCESAARGHQFVHDGCNGPTELTAEDPELPPPPEPLAN